MSTESSSAARRQRPVWLAAALTLFSLGLYYVWWFGATWAELKRERRDPTMRPVWHALTSIVPVYASFRTHAHFRALADLAKPHVPGLSDGAAWATWIVSIEWVVAVVSLVTQGLFAVLLSLIGAALYAVVIWRGQSDFNAYLRATGGEPRERAHTIEIIALVLSVLFAIAWVGAVLLSPA